MILAEVGGTAAADAVVDDTDAVDVETPDDRPARRARREAGAGDAGFGEQEIAERGAACTANFLIRHDGHSRKLIRHDRQYALLGRDSGGRRRSFRCALTAAAGRRTSGAHW